MSAPAPRGNRGPRAAVRWGMRLLPVLATWACVARAPAESTLPGGGLVRHAGALAALEAARAAPDPIVRAAALGALIRVSPGPDGGPAAPAAVFDPDPWVADEALRALETRAAAPPVAALLARRMAAPGAPGAACGAALVLLRAGQPVDAASLDAVRARAAGTADAGLCALAALGAGGGAEIFLAGLREGELPLDPRLLRALSSAPASALDAAEAGLPWLEPVVAPAVAAALAAAGRAAGTTALAAHLADPDPALRWEVLEAARSLGAPIGLPLALTASGDGDPSIAAAGALLRWAWTGEGSPRAAAAAADRDLRRFAADAAGAALRARGPRATGATELLHGLLGDEEAPIRRAACAALGHHPDLRARAPAEALLTDEDPRVQVAAARALLGIGG